MTCHDHDWLYKLRDTLGNCRLAQHKIQSIFETNQIIFGTSNNTDDKTRFFRVN